MSFILYHIHYVILFSVIWNITSVTNKETTFSKQRACKLEARLSSECAQEQGREFKSLTECATECAKEDVCLGITFDTNCSCYYHKKCSQSFECHDNKNEAKMFTIYIKGGNSLEDVTSSTTPAPICQNDGVWNTAADDCICSGGWVGRFCERLAKSCQELSEHGYPQGWPEGLHWVKLKTDIDHTPFQVLCELRVTYCNTYIMRNNGLTSQKLTTQQEYLDGFYKSHECFWLGLKNMKVLNDAGHTTVCVDVGFSTSNFNLFQMTYFGFILGNMATGFNFTFRDSKRKQTGPVHKKLKYGDCLKPVKEAKFYTPDEQVESVGKTCAQQAGTGWWFKGCPLSCNPLGYKTEYNVLAPKTYKIIMDGIDCENIHDCMVSIYFVTHIKDD